MAKTYLSETLWRIQIKEPATPGVTRHSTECLTSDQVLAIPEWQQGGYRAIAKKLFSMWLPDQSDSAEVRLMAERKYKARSNGRPQWEAECMATFTVGELRA